MPYTNAWNGGKPYNPVLPLFFAPDGNTLLFPSVLQGMPVTSTSLGTAGNSNPGVQSVQGVVGGTPLAVTMTGGAVPPTTNSSSTQSVTTSSTPLVGANPNAKILLIQNTGTSSVYITPGATASAANAMYQLNPGQGIKFSIAANDGVYVTSQWSAISVSGTNPVIVSVAV